MKYYGFRAGMEYLIANRGISESPSDERYSPK